jgi:regulator of sigma E protease
MTEFILGILNFLLISVIFLFVFGLLVFIHELGHFLASRLTGTKVVEFAIGFGPQIIAWKGKETNWVLRAVPFGGYCQIEGQEEFKDAPDSYSSKNYLQKVFILSGGVLMNFLLSVVIFYVIVGGMSNFVAVFPKISETNFIFGQQEEFSTSTTTYEKVIADLPAEKAGFKEAGTIKMIGGKEIYTSDAIFETLAQYKNKEVEIAVSYEDGGVNDKLEKYKVTPTKEGRIGVMLKESPAYLVKYEGVEKFFVGVVHSINLLQFQVEGIASLISESNSTGSITPVAKNVSSPIGIFVGVKAFFSVAGFLGILNLLGLLSLALAFFNILPFPALDGGHIVIVTIEKVIGRPISMKIQNAIALVGFSFLILLMLLVTVKDLIQFGAFDIFR